MPELDTTYLPPGAEIVIACSGGGDSVALLHLLADRAPQRDWRLLVAHFDHGLRPTSAGEARFVRELAAERDLPVISERAAVGEDRRGGESMEGTARRLRYDFLCRVRDTHVPGGLIATGHTRDDQLETVALRLERGAGVRGLRAILPRRADGVVRPLLGVRRNELRTWLEARGARWCEDESNRDTSLDRNRWRRCLEALDEGDYSGLLDAADDLSRRARALQPEIEGLAQWWLTGRSQHGPGTAADRDRTDRPVGPGALLSGEIVLERPETPAHLGKLEQALLDAALERTGTDPRTVSSRVRDAVLHLWRRGGAPGGGYLVQIAPRLWAESTAAGLLLVAGGDPHWERGASWQGRIDPNATGAGAASRGSLILPRGGTLSWHPADPGTCEKLQAGGTISGLDGRRTTILPAPRRGRTYTVRYPRAGDRLHPFGAAGSASLADLFGQARVPRLRRARLPVVESGPTILWLAAVRTAEPARLAGDEPALQIHFDPV